jgi:LacI family transcriptional regulator
MSVTIKKIAELAGVSRGTVDRVLNERGRVNPDVAKRVMELANSLNYKPNTVAKSLATRKKSFKIGFVIHLQGNPFYDYVIAGIKAASEEMKDFGISVIIKYGRNFDVENQLLLIDEVLSEGVNALAIVPLNDDRIINRINNLQADNFPVVLLVSNAESVDKVAYVGVDFYKVGEIAAGLMGLVTNGRANLLLATPSLTMLGNMQRIKGFISVINSQYPDINIVNICEFPNNDIESYNKACQILSENPNIDAILITTGAVSGLLKAIQDVGLFSKVKIISLDLADQIVDAIKSGLITATIFQHPFKQGYRATKILFDYLISGDLPQQKNVFIDCEIKIKQSFY